MATLHFTYFFKLKECLLNIIAELLLTGGMFYFVRPLEYLIKKLPIPTTRATNIFIKIKPCNAMLRILVVRIRSYVKSGLRYIFLNFGYLSPGQSMFT
jgi:hypothetical protein